MWEKNLENDGYVYHWITFLYIWETYYIVNQIYYNLNTCIHTYINERFLLYRTKNQSHFEVLPYVPDGNEKIPDHPCLLGIYHLLGGKLTYRESYQ